MVFEHTSKRLAHQQITAATIKQRIVIDKFLQSYYKFHHMEGVGKNPSKDYGQVLEFVEIREGIPTQLMSDPRPTRGDKAGEDYNPDELIARGSRFLVLNNMDSIHGLPLRKIKVESLMIDIARTRRSLEGFVDKINLMCGYTSDAEMAETAAQVFTVAEKLGLDAVSLFAEQDVCEVYAESETYPWIEPTNIDDIKDGYETSTTEEDEQFGYLLEQASVA